MTKILINGIEVKYEDKIALNSAFNETLDTGVIIIPNSEELSIKRLDSAQIVNENGDTIKYLKVGTIVKEFETFEEPFKYRYTIELVSSTIDLQSIVLPNISITQPLDITGVAKRSIYYQLDRLVKVFAPEFSISDELKLLTENIECPENQYNRKTLFEVFNDLLINVPAVVTVLENNVISCIRLDVVGEEINHDKIVNVVETKRIDEYSTEIEMSAENVVEGQANTFTALAVSPRSQDYIMTTDNAQIILDKPIYRIEKIEMMIPNESTRVYYALDGTPNSVDVSYIPIDITRWVVEETVYKTKLPYEVAKLTVLTNGKVNPELYKYKRAFLSYSQGSNIIDNLSYREKGLFGITINQFSLAVAYAASVIEYALTVIPSNAIITGIDALEEIVFINDPRDVIFNVTYISQTGLRFRVKKPNTDNTNYKLLIDNQSNSYVDSQSLWKAEKENAKRIGNPELKINMILDSIDEIPEYGAKFGDYILTNSSSNIYANKIIFEGYFTKDYIRKNLYTGIRSKARWTSIAKESEALKRQDLLIIDYELTTEEIDYSVALLNFLFSNLGVENKNNLELTITTISENFDSHGSFLLQNSVYSFGTNLIYSFNFKDNFNAGMAIGSIQSAQYVMAQTPYVNNLGEFKYLSLKFYEQNNKIEETSLSKSQNLPRYTTSISDKILESFYLLVMKDNREIYGADIQIRFNSNNEVILQDELINQFSITNKPKTQKLLFFGFNKRKLTEKDNNIREFAQEGEGIEFTTELIDYYGITQPTWVGWDKTNTKSWGICTENFDVLFVCNSNAEKIYFKKGGHKLC